MMITSISNGDGRKMLGLNLRTLSRSAQATDPSLTFHITQTEEMTLSRSNAGIGEVSKSVKLSSLLVENKKLAFNSHHQISIMVIW